jgi:ubiquinone/menaquinone biosynthesis C-methylase UbiE
VQNDKKYEYGDVTEAPDTKASREQLTRLYTRYRFASEFCNERDVLEVACGAGLGLGYLARSAKRVVGGDIHEDNLKFARKTYNGRPNIYLYLLDAHNLPFHTKSFDVLILYEALYYFAQPEKFMDEAQRVLKDKGVFILCTANKDWAGFNPSPYSYRYFSAPELYSLLKKRDFEVRLFGDCPAYSARLKDKIISAIKQMAVKLYLIPKTMKGKEKLKRIFFGKLKPLPPEISDGMADYILPVPIPHDLPNTQYKVLFAVGYVRS